MTSRTTSTRRRLAALVIAVLVTAVPAACAAGQIPEVPVAADGTQDAQLLLGRQVWEQRCIRCHGASGGGGTGPKISEGLVAAKYPNPDVQLSIVTQGLNGRMPGFRTLLTAEEIEAVVAYTRDVL